ncbi:hypothetical protein VAE122_3070022 [Vibrio aestuarianus]|nr:hypothetical protein VAE122_3070022 [Vibrio aestuarianus]
MVVGHLNYVIGLSSRKLHFKVSTLYKEPTNRCKDQLESMDLIARKLLSVDLSLYASPQYLEQYGTPQTPMDLELHEFILFRKFDGKIDRRLNFNNESVTVSGRLIVNDVGLLTQSCLDHQGISCIADHDTQEYVENGKLVKLLPNYRTEQGKRIINTAF